MKLFKLLFYLILVLLPVGELLRFEFGINITIKPLDVTVGLTALCWIIFIFFNPSHRPTKKLLIPFVAFGAICLVSLLANISWLKQNEFLASLLYLIRWVSYATLPFIVFQFDKKIKKQLGLILFIDGLLFVLLGYIQYFFYPNLKSLYHLGWDEHMHRMFSTLFDPNFAGALFVLYFLFLAGVFYKFSKEKNKKNEKIFIGIILSLTLLAILLTFSRAAILMLIVGSSVFLFLINQKKLILVILGVIILFAFGFSSQFYIENINLFRQASSKARLDNYSMALKIISEKPLLGVGFNTYRYAKKADGVKSEWTNAPSHADAGVDNSFLFVLATTGIIGFGVYLWVWFTLLKKAYQQHKKKDIFSTIFIAASIGLFINALFINSLFFPVLLVWMWVLFGLTV